MFVDSKKETGKKRKVEAINPVDELQVVSSKELNPTAKKTKLSPTPLHMIDGKAYEIDEHDLKEFIKTKTKKITATATATATSTSTEDFSVVQSSPVFFSGQISGSKDSKDSSPKSSASIAEYEIVINVSLDDDLEEELLESEENLGSPKGKVPKTPPHNVVSSLEASPVTAGSRSTHWEGFLNAEVFVSRVPSTNPKRMALHINKGRSKTSVKGGGQGDHVTAYVVLLQMLFSFVDGENKQNACDIIEQTVQCFMSEKEQDEFKTYISCEKEVIDKNFLSKEKLKELAYGALKDLLEKDIIIENLKQANRELYANFVVKASQYLLQKMNKSKLAALPRLSGAAKGEKETIQQIRILNIFEPFLVALGKCAKEEHKKLIEDFYEEFKRVLRFGKPKIDDEEKIINNFNIFVSQLYGKDFSKDKSKTVVDLVLNNIKVFLKPLKLNTDAVGGLFETLFDFNKKNIRKSTDAEIDKEDGSIGDDDKIIFHKPENALFEVSARHLNLMFIVIRNISISNKEREEIISAFLNKTLEVQGWINFPFKKIEKKKAILLKLQLKSFYDEIKKDLVFFNPSKTASEIVEKNRMGPT